MAVNTAAFFVVNPDPSKAQGALIPESAPTFLWGQGTPDGDREPFLSAQKGSLYAEVDATDDTALLWVKVDEGNDNDDWVRSFVENQLLIDNADIAAAAGIVGSKLATNARVQLVMSKEFNIDNGSGTTDDDLILHTDRAITVISAQVVYTEATDTAGVASANIKLGTAAGGAQLVAATAYQVSKAVGDKTAMTLVTGAGAVAADGEIWARHTGIAATEAGKAKVLVTFVVND
jgi:hypothetical protein